jgi:hypothetical protein
LQGLVLAGECQVLRQLAILTRVPPKALPIASRSVPKNQLAEVAGDTISRGDAAPCASVEWRSLGINQLTEGGFGSVGEEKSGVRYTRMIKVGM